MSLEHLTLVHHLEVVTPIPLSEKLADHRVILQSYLDTHITRNHSCVTIEGESRFLDTWFKGFPVKDDTHPDGYRQLFVWEAMEPWYGRQRIVEYGKGLMSMGLSPRTLSSYVGSLRRLFKYVLDYPYIPNSHRGSIVAKYGRIEQPVSHYDYPVHVVDQEEEGFVLTGKRLADFYNFVRLDYVKRNQKEATASRNYSMIVTGGESGLRASEILYLDALGPHRDLFYKHNRIQTRYGKGFKGSGKRTRKTIMTPLAKVTLQIYEERIRPRFPMAKCNPALFLTESGKRMSYGNMASILKCVVKQARLAGLSLPHSLTWHDLRRSFATNWMERHPDQVWVLMDMMGHINPSTLHRYVRFDQSHYEKAIDSFVRELMPKLE